MARPAEIREPRVIRFYRSFPIAGHKTSFAIEYVVFEESVGRSWSWRGAVTEAIIN
jgi:hypothetical protein